MKKSVSKCRHAWIPAREEQEACWIVCNFGMSAVGYQARPPLGHCWMPELRLGAWSPRCTRRQGCRYLAVTKVSPRKGFFNAAETWLPESQCAKRSRHRLRRGRGYHLSRLWSPSEVSPVAEVMRIWATAVKERVSETLGEVKVLGCTTEPTVGFPNLVFADHLSCPSFSIPTPTPASTLGETWRATVLAKSVLHPSLLPPQLT